MAQSSVLPVAVGRLMREQLVLELRQMTSADVDGIQRLQVTAEQQAYVEPLSETLATTARARDNFVIVAAEEVVGFFQIDCREQGQIIDKHLELHEVVIDAHHQGKGYGQEFLRRLKPFLEEQYATWKGVCLTVNCRNVHAFRLYLKGGFEDTGQLQQEGRSGPQHIMKMALNP